MTGKNLGEIGFGDAQVPGHFPARESLFLFILAQIRKSHSWPPPRYSQIPNNKSREIFVIYEFLYYPLETSLFANIE